MDSTHKVKYHVRDLSTRSVTLFLSRAQVFREIPNVPLQPGLNEITVLGLSPTVDDQSIRVEGSGSAIISDITVEPLPVRESFVDVHPDSELDNGWSNSDDDDDDEEAPDLPEGEDLLNARSEYLKLKDELDNGIHLCATSEERRKALRLYSQTLSCEWGVPIGEAVEALQTAQESIALEYSRGFKLQREVEKPLREARKKLQLLEKAYEKEKKSASKQYVRALAEKTKLKEKAARQKKERLSERQRLRAEKHSFWPKYCYSVRILLAVNNLTPSVSRRGSISSDFGISHIDLGADDSPISSPAAQSSCNLVLSYVTTSAYWSPNYDLQLSTTSGNGRLLFDASLHNATSETWDKCKITLSTSQTVFGGVEETAPVLTPWKIKLLNRGSRDERTILRSKAEEEQKRLRLFNHKNVGIFKNRSDMFGSSNADPVPRGNPQQLEDYQMQLMLLEQQNKKRLMMARQEAVGNTNPVQAVAAAKQAPTVVSVAFGAPQPNNFASNTTGSSVFGNHQHGSGLFGSSQPQTGGFGTNSLPPPPPPPPGNIFQAQAEGSFGGGGLFGQQQSQQQQQQQQQQQSLELQQPAPHSFFTPDQAVASQAIIDDAPDSDDESDAQLDYQESNVEETGFSTQYDLPGEKRLEPRTHDSKQRVAQINLKGTMFTHTVVAKYKPVAYLSAKLTNPSKITLLKGPVGVTLDGSFMGRSNLPRFVGGETISLGLGVDPAIKVQYQAPEAKNATTGFFTKEEITIYDRVLRLENTRSTTSTTAINLVARDQIPVPSDDKVRVELLKPEGLVLGTESTEGKPTGIPGRTKREDDKEWGTAKAYLKKTGEITWAVDLSPSKAVKLELQYLVATPIGERAYEV